MSSEQPSKLKLHLPPILVGLFSFLVLVWLSMPWVRINTTASAPLGLYVEGPDGPYARFCVTEEWAREAVLRGYIDTNWNRECNFRKPLLKRIAAYPGDTVRLDAQGISVNGRLMPNTAPQARDSRGRIMTPYRYGEYTVALGEVWVAGDHVQSFDSRYMGPVRPTAFMSPLVDW